jgi:hypothetical protein
MPQAGVVQQADPRDDQRLAAAVAVGHRHALDARPRDRLAVGRVERDVGRATDLRAARGDLTGGRRQVDVQQAAGTLGHLAARVDRDDVVDVAPVR